MKKVFAFILLFQVMTLLTGCSEICVGPNCIIGESDSDLVDTSNVLPYVHINGYGTETTKNAYILFEAELRDYVKYQVAYLACTCRDSIVNYWSVMYIEVAKGTNEVMIISWDKDGQNGHYTPGTWGDSSGDSSQNYVTYEQFKNDFVPWFIGKALYDFEGIYVFDNDGHLGISNDVIIQEQDLIDEFAGSSVSTNNILRVIKEILAYHETIYS